MSPSVPATDYRQEGSTVVARDGDVNIEGKRVSIVQSEASESSAQEREIELAGLTVAISCPLSSVTQTSGQMTQAVGTVKAPRMNALGVAGGWPHSEKCGRRHQEPQGCGQRQYLGHRRRIEACKPRDQRQHHVQWLESLAADEENHE